jgi:sterol desaturase/sphingolipid hydroxylase (fatty acid hydroxylase superfamily)
MSLGSILSGAATWSAAEYFIHRFAGHEYAHTRNFFAVEHTRHHATTSYFAFAGKKVAAAVVTGALLAPLASLVAGPRRGLSFTFGFLATYAGYEWLHLRSHTHAPKTAYGRWARKNHFFHHFHDPSVNHGVTSPFWDIAFGTHHPVDVVRVPPKHAMPWLVDEQGEIRSEHQHDYVLAKKRARAQGTGAAADA